jgi:lipid II:glycine glycyltransferase (peptidoglycan interpeptide bridge formation enzyme)
MIKDIRQSDEWSNHIAYWGWETFSTTDNVKIYIKKDLLGTFSKIQRPKILNAKDLAEIENICKKEKCTFVKLEPNLKQDLKILNEWEYLESNTPLAPPATLIIDLKKSHKNLEKDISKSGQYAINRAKREKDYVEIFSNPTDKTLDLFHRVLLESGNYNRATVYSLDVYKKMREIFGNNLIVFISKNELNEVCGTTLYLQYEKGVWYMFGGTTQTGRNNKSGYLLHWQAIEHFKKQGLDFLDLEGIYDERFHKHTKNWEGFTIFKKKFGGEVVEFPKPRFKIFSPKLNALQKVAKFKL